MGLSPFCYHSDESEVYNLQVCHTGTFSNNQEGKKEITKKKKKICCIIKTYDVTEMCSESQKYSASQKEQMFVNVHAFLFSAQTAVRGETLKEELSY